ncbi:MAG: hypothetical protein ABIF71_10880 [Planctomycetota bacterium]
MTKTMNTVERFHAIMDFKPVDRLPAIEWAPWWNQTLDRWLKEGLDPAGEGGDIYQTHFGLDVMRKFWIAPGGEKLEKLRKPGHESCFAADAREYDAVKAISDAGLVLNEKALRQAAAEHAAGKTMIFLQVEGFFWYPRKVLGIQRHLVTFYDDPGLMHRINRDILEYNKRVLAAFRAFMEPDIIVVAEDLSYNHGPMLSAAMFEEFCAPYYRESHLQNPQESASKPRSVVAATRITTTYRSGQGVLQVAREMVPLMRQGRSRVFVDSDGDITPLIPWLQCVGVEGILPLERMAGVDVAAIRKQHPRWLMFGAFDKTVMHRGTAAVRAEFERLLPVMQGGGFLPSVDHQTPPGVSLAQYREYAVLLNEYCRKAGNA